MNPTSVLGIMKSGPTGNVAERMDIVRVMFVSTVLLAVTLARQSVHGGTRLVGRKRVNGMKMRRVFAFALV